MEQTLERAAVFLERHGLVVFMKGPSADAEIQQALSAWGGDFRLKDDLPYRLGRTSHQRRLVVFERISEAPSEPKTGGFGARIVEVASAQNPKFKVWEKLLDSRGLRRYGLALVSGPKQVRELVTERREICDAVLLKGLEDPAEDMPPDLGYFRLRPELFRRLDLFGAGSPLVVVRIPSIEEWQDRDWPAGCTLFVPFQDPGNVGAVIRSAAAFGVARVVLLKRGGSSLSSAEFEGCRAGCIQDDLPAGTRDRGFGGPGGGSGGPGHQRPGFAVFCLSRSVRLDNRPGGSRPSGALPQGDPDYPHGGRSGIVECGPRPRRLYFITGSTGNILQTKRPAVFIMD